MSDPAQNPPSEGHGLGLFGKTVASVTHEYTNVLSIIGQVAGLIDDIAVYAQQGHALDPERIRKQSDRIVAQVTRGVAITRELNRFAHSLDTPWAQLDLLELAGNTVALLQPRAARQEVDLLLDPADGAIPVTCRPFRLRVLLAEVLEAAIAVSQAGESVTLTVRSVPDGAEMIVIASRFSDNLQGDGASTLAEQMGVRIEQGSAGGGRQLWRIHLPLEPKGASGEENPNG